MSRSISISLLPSPTSEELVSMAEEYVRTSYTRALPDAQVPLDPDTFQAAVDTCLEQVDKSLLERHNLKWNKGQDTLLVLDQEELENYSEEEAEEAVNNLIEIVKTSGILSGKALKSLALNDRERTK